ncbi:MAG: ABC transporter permease [Longimicrobiales bacterium]
MPRDYKRAFRLGRHTSGDADRAVDEELAFHIEQAVEELVAEGWPAERARQEAIRRFGDLDDTRSYCVDMQTRRERGERRTMMIEELWQDLKYAFRALGSAPGYAGLVVATLAFGIAANTTIFSVMNPYFFRPLPYGDADGLVHVAQVDPVTGWDMDRFSLPMVEDWADRSTTLESLGAYTYTGANVTGPEGPEGVTLARVTADMFGILRSDAALGRTFSPDEGGPGGADVAVLSHPFWNRRYNADPDVVGRTIAIDGVTHTVVGVMPEDFVFPFGGVRLWVPVREDPTTASRTRTPYLMVGRMAPGVTRERVATDLTRVQAELSARYPDADGRWAGVTVLPMRQALNFVWDMLSTGFAVLLAAVAFVLAIACVNVASLTLARGSTRAREVAVRSALGASRGRLVRQLLTESLLLALAGGAVGVGLSYMAAAVVGPVIPEDLYRVGRVSIDGTVLGFSMLVTLATPLIFGLLPALAATRRDLVTGLKEGSKGSGSRGTMRGRRALVVTQVALAVVLTTGSGLMLRSLSAVQDIDLGFDAERTVLMNVQPPASDYTTEEVETYVEEAIARMASVPGVSASSAALYVPLNNETPSVQFAPPERAGAPGAEWPIAIPNYVFPRYFETLGIPLLAGRAFTTSDNRQAAPVVVVNQAMAERFWPDGSPVGRTVLLGDPDDPLEATVVGVAGNVLHEALDADRARAQLYRPALQVNGRRHFLLARTEGDPAGVAAPLRQTLLELDPDLPFAVQPMTGLVDQARLQWSLGSVFLAVFGGGALLLATLGIYGLVAFSVAQREREVGVRIALGATKGQVRSAVVGDGVRLTGIGLAVGLVAAAALARLAASALYGVEPFDPFTLGGVLALFLIVAAAASWVPAVRATRTDPITVLRSE